MHAIVVVEQTHKKLEEWERTGRKGDYREVIVGAIKGGRRAELLRPPRHRRSSFLPVLTLEAEEGRLFRPLAYTKTLAMVVAAFLAITLDPALRLACDPFQEFPFPAPLAVPGGERRRSSARSGRKKSIPSAVS